MHFYYSIIIIFWILFFLFVVYLVGKRDKVLFERISPYLIFITVFFYYLTLIPKGLDITDEGFSLTKAWFILHGGWDENVDAIWLSSLFNGLWLSIIGYPSVFWARIGFTVIISLSSMVTFLILEQYFEKIRTFITVSLLTACYTINTFFSISYYILPILLILISLYLILRFISYRNFNLLIVAGFLVAILGFFKVSFFVAPLIYLVFIEFNKGMEKSEFRKALRYSIIGLLSGYLSGFILLLLSGSLKLYIQNATIAIGLLQNPFPTSDLSHTVNNLLLYYSQNFYRFTCTFLCGLFILLTFLVFISNLKRTHSRLIVTGLFIYFVYLAAKNGDSDQWQYITMSFSFTFLFLNILNKKSYPLHIVVNASIALFILSFLGSNGGFISGFESGGMLLLSTLSVLIIDDSEVDENQFIKRYSLRYLKYFLFGFLILVLIWKKPDDVYRERPRKELNSAFKAASLRGIVSNQPRVNSLDSMLLEYEKIRKSNSGIEISTLTINSNPLFYYLTETKPFLSNPWFISIKEFEQKLKDRGKPDMLIFSIQNPRDGNWPKFNSKPCDGLDSLDYNYFMEFVKRCNYYSPYKNRMFQIFIKPEFYFNQVGNNIVIEESASPGTMYWEKLRPNCSILQLYDTVLNNTECLIINEIDAGIAGIKKSILEIDNLYFVTAEVRSDFNANILLQAGGGISSIPKSVNKNEWTEIKGLLKASGTDFLVYAENLAKGCKISVRKIGVFKAVEKTDQQNY